MAGCDLLDLRCIFVSELVGSAILSIVLAAILLFMFFSRTRIGFKTSMVASVPLLLIFGMAITSFSVLYAFITVLIGLMLAAVFQKVIGNQGFI